MLDALKYPVGWIRFNSSVGCRVLIVLILGGVPCLCGIASAQEATTYKYDARGRLIQVQRSGGPESGTISGYTYDNADNRTQVNITGSPNGSGSDRDGGASAPGRFYVVVPLNGYAVITGIH